MDLPQRARVVVVGAGVIGTSVAYHLAHQGCADVVLLERDRLTSGTTWHAAGLIVTFGSTSETSTRMRMYTRDLYARLEAETGLSTGLKRVGFIELATDHGRLEEYRRVAAFNRFCGVEVHEISPGEAKELFPLARVDDVLAGFYVPDDGRANPVDVTMSLARGARMRGVRIIEGVPVTGFPVGRGAVRGVRTPYGDIEAEYVVNCAGMWARQLGATAGVTIPLQAAEHYYLITQPIDGVDGSLPILEDPASYGYFREEGGGLMLGLFEPVRAVAGRGSTGGLLLRRAATGLEPHRVVPGKGDAASPTHAGHPSTHLLLRPGELHARPAAGGRRGTRASQLLRAGRVELDRHPDRRRDRAGARPLDPGRAARHRRDRVQHRPAARVPEQPGVPGDPYRRGARHGLPVPLPGPGDAHGPRRQVLPAASPAGRTGRVLQGRVRLGEPGLVRAGGRAAGRRSPVLGPAELVPPLGSRAPGGPRGRDPHGHVVHVEVPCPGA